MAAESQESARRVPIFATVPKMVFPLFVILPGMIAAVATAGVTAHGTVPAEGLLPAKLTASGTALHDSVGRIVADYDLATPMMLVHFFPSGMLGLGLTALLANVMPGMAGNVPAFNTVWTYDIYQAYLRRNAPDRHYVLIGRIATVAGVALSVAAAYLAASFNNIMDLLQSVFAFVNAPLFATFALGMFWKRTTGNGAFCGLFAGMAAAAIHHGISLPQGAPVGIHGGFLGVHLLYGSDLGQAFWTAIVAFSTCVAVTTAVSLVTRPAPEEHLRGLVYSSTDRRALRDEAWYRRPESMAAVVLVVALALELWLF